jgi:hypothetical protein
MIYVGRGQVETRTLADRIVLLRDGVIERRRTRRTAGSTSRRPVAPAARTNLMMIQFERTAAGAAMKLEEREPVNIFPQGRYVGARHGLDVILGLRPTDVRRCGRELSGRARIAGQPAIDELQTKDVNRVGERILVDLSSRRAVPFDVGTLEALLR